LIAWTRAACATRACTYHDVLADALGEHSFDGSDDHPYGHEALELFLTHPDGPGPTAVAFAAAWDDLQSRARLDGVEGGPLGTTAAGAVNIRQRELTTAVEAREIADLRDDFAALPADDRRRQAFFQISGPLCNEWVTTLPDTIGFFTTAEFPEVVARYLLLPSPALRPFVGARILEAGSRRAQPLLCDAFGDNLGRATLKGDAHSIYHDGCLAEIFSLSIHPRRRQGSHRGLRPLPPARAAAR